MSKPLGRTTFTFLIFLSALAGVFGIACYKCNSYTDANHSACLDPMDPYPIVNATLCGSGYVCTRVSYTTQKTFITSRGCDLSNNTCAKIKVSLQSYYPDLSNFNCYSCSKNYCNGVSGNNSYV